MDPHRGFDGGGPGGRFGAVLSAGLPRRGGVDAAFGAGDLADAMGLEGRLGGFADPRHLRRGGLFEAARGCRGLRHRHALLALRQGAGGVSHQSAITAIPR